MGMGVGVGKGTNSGARTPHACCCGDVYHKMEKSYHIIVVRYKEQHF